MPSGKLKKTSKKLKEDPYLVIKWYWTYYFKKYWPILVIGIFFMSLEGSMLGLLSYSIKSMFDKVFIPSNQSALISVGFIIFLIFFSHFGESTTTLILIISLNFDQSKLLLFLKQVGV